MKLTRTTFFSALALFSLSQGVQTAYAGDDLVFVAVDPPCRIVDTRATGTTRIPADGSTDFLGFGDAGDLDSQGGDAAGCPNPRPGSRPVAISANVVAVGGQATGNGNLVAYAAESIAPDTSLVNYQVGTNIANSSIIALCQGTCASDFTLQSNFSSVPATVDLQGFLYPKTLQNVITVSAENGDFTSPVDAINSIPTTGLDAPSASNPYLIKIGPGVYGLDTAPLTMKSFVSIIGAGVDATTITSTANQGTVRAVNVIDAELAHMTIIADGENSTNSSFGVFVDALTGNSTNAHLHDLKIIAQRGTNNTNALFIGVDGIRGIIEPLIERVDAVAQNSFAGQESGINIRYCDDTRLERVNAFSDERGLTLGADADCANPILWSQFDGGTDDVFTDGGANATLGHSHLVNGTRDLNTGGLGTITCVAVTTPTATLESDCTDPP